LTPKFAIDKQAARAKENGVSVYTQRKLDRLARDYPELHAKVSAGEMSVNKAAKAAGFVKEPSDCFPHTGLGLPDMGMVLADAIRQVVNHG